MPLELDWFSMTFADHIVGAMICIVAPLLVMGTRKLADQDLSFTPADKIRLYHQNGLFLIVIALIVVTVWRLPGRGLQEFGFTMPVWTSWGRLAVAAVILFYVLDIFFQYGLRRWRERSLAQRAGNVFFMPVDRDELGHFAFLSAAAGFGEEIIFRGFLLHYLVFWLGHTPADVIAAGLFSSVLFAYLHGYQGRVAMVKIFLLALLLAAVFIFTKSLWPVIFLHTGIDVFSGWLGVRLYKSMPRQQPTDEES